MLWDVLQLLAVALLHCPMLFFWANCPCCGTQCECCTSDPTAEYDLTLAGFSNVGSCTGCTILNSTFTLTQDGDCNWVYALPSIACDGPSTCDLTYLHFFCFGSQSIVQVDNSSTPFSTDLVYEFVMSDSPIDCANLSSFPQDRGGKGGIANCFFTNNCGNGPFTVQLTAS